RTSACSPAARPSTATKSVRNWAFCSGWNRRPKSARFRLKRISCQRAACFGLLLGVTSWLYGNPLPEGLTTPAEPSLALAGVATEPTTLFHGTIPSLRIHISDSEFAKLVQDVRQYVKATVTEGENVYTDVGIHAKGGFGSFRPLDRNPSLTLNFDKFR